MEFGGGGAAAGEDGNTVSVGVGIDEGDCGGEVWGGEADEDGAEDFFGIAFHVGLDGCDDCGGELVIYQ